MKKEKSNLNISQLTTTALFTALTAAGAFVTVPLPVIPFTAQLLVTSLAGIILGPRLGALSQIVYVSLGLIGVPIFAKGGGPSYILQPSFGYLLGFILCAFLTGILINGKEESLIKLYSKVMFGLLSVYAIGVPYLYLIQKLYIGKDVTLLWAIKYGMIMTLPGDFIKGVFISIIAYKLVNYSVFVKMKRTFTKA